MHLTEGAHLGGDSSVNNLVLGVSLRGFSLTTPLRDFNPGSPLCGALSLGPPLFVGSQNGSSVEDLGCRVLSGVSF